MLQVSENPVAGGVEVKNCGFGNRCLLCGGYFDEGGICNSGHQQDQTYYLTPESKGVKRSAKPSRTLTNTTMICRAHCNICGDRFRTKNVCVNGHEIGEQYAV